MFVSGLPLDNIFWSFAHAGPPPHWPPGVRAPPLDGNPASVTVCPPEVAAVALWEPESGALGTRKRRSGNPKAALWEPESGALGTRKRCSGNPKGSVQRGRPHPWEATMGLQGVHLITDDYRRPPYCGPLGGAGMAPLAANRGPRPARTAWRPLVMCRRRGTQVDTLRPHCGTSIPVGEASRDVVPKTNTA